MYSSECVTAGSIKSLEAALPHSSLYSAPAADAHSRSNIAGSSGALLVLELSLKTTGPPPHVFLRGSVVSSPAQAAEF